MKVKDLRASHAWAFPSALLDIFFILFYENYLPNYRIAQFNSVLTLFELSRWNDDVFGLKGRNFVKSHVPLSILPSKRSFEPIENRHGKRGCLKDHPTGIIPETKNPKKSRKHFCNFKY